MSCREGIACAGCGPGRGLARAKRPFGALRHRSLFGELRLHPPAADRAQHGFFKQVGHGCHHAAHQPSLDAPDKGPFGNIAHGAVSVYRLSHFSQSVCKMTVVPHKRRRERNRDQAQPSSGLLQPCRPISVVQVASIPVSVQGSSFSRPLGRASSRRTGLCQAKAPLAHGSRARRGSGSALCVIAYYQTSAKPTQTKDTILFKRIML
jgi:hypothetical protein